MHNALVISPFASTPLDAGHRRRVFQMTQLLVDAGYRVTFLLYAFEDSWYWRHKDDAWEDLRRQWEEVLVFYGDRGVGAPPKDGNLHHLDEWWDPAFESMLGNLNSRRFFDLVVVHNVWLSKALDSFPPNTVKVLETHDLFWKRKAVFERLGMKPEFFLPSEDAEIFGCKRADVSVAIQGSEGAELWQRTGKPVVTTPFYDAQLEPFARSAERTQYLSADKVTFGVLASDNAFNVAGLNALLVELERVIGDTFAPVEILAAGRVGDRIVKRAGVKCVGFVETEAQFFDTVDFAITPVFEGTGFKIKTADALALLAPTLFSAHAAEGCDIHESLIFEGPRDMALRMAEIALERPPIAKSLARVRRARQELRKRVEEGGRALIETIEGARDHLAIDLSRLTPTRDLLSLFSWMATVRLFSERFAVWLILSREAKAVLGPRLPLAVSGMSTEEFRASRRPSMTILEVDSAIDREGLDVGPMVLALHDVRWRKTTADLDPALGVLGDMPLLSPNMIWEPACLALRRFVAGPAASHWRVEGRRIRVVYIDKPIGIERIDFGGESVSVFIPVSDEAAFAQSIFGILDGAIAEVVWSAQPSGLAHRFLIEAAAICKIAFHGGLDPAVVATGWLPHTLAQDFSARSQAMLLELKDNLPQLGKAHELRQTA